MFYRLYRKLRREREGAMRARLAITAAIAVTAYVGAAFAEAKAEDGGQAWLASVAEPEGHYRDIVQRMDMRVSSLHVGADAAEVERVLGRPTNTTVLEGSGGDNRALVYAEEPVRTQVTLIGGRVTAIALELVHIDITSLGAHARMVKPMMVRGGVLALLGRPDADEKWTAFGMEIERMLFRRPGESNFGVFFADGFVVDARSGAETPPDIQHVVLPATIADASIGTHLRIGLNPTQAASLLGSAVWTPVVSTFKGQPVLYATYHERGGRRLVSLAFTGGVLTAFAIWSPDTTLDLGETCCSADQ